MYACDHSCLERLLPLQPLPGRTNLVPILPPRSSERTLMGFCIAVCARASANSRFVGKKQDECRAKPRRIGEVFDEDQTVRTTCSSDGKRMGLIMASACVWH